MLDLPQREALRDALVDDRPDVVLERLRAALPHRVDERRHQPVAAVPQHLGARRRGSAGRRAREVPSRPRPRGPRRGRREASRARRPWSVSCSGAILPRGYTGASCASSWRCPAGVDSSVAAALLVERGPRGDRRVDAAARRDGGEGPRSAAAARSRTSTTRGAWPRRLGIPHYVVEPRALFQDGVVDALRATTYLEGRTPLPCVALQPEREVREPPRADARARRRRAWPPATTRGSDARRDGRSAC